MRRARWFVAAALALALLAPGGAAQEDDRLVVYSGRSESLVGPIIAQFESATGVQVEVRYGDTPQLAATLLEEGAASPADLFYAQDPGGLGAVEPLLRELPDALLDRVAGRFRSPEGLWVGISGRPTI